MPEIKLGDKVRCKVTGFVGIAVMKTEFLNGCVQYAVAPQVGKDNKLQEEMSIDQQQLEVITPKDKPKERSSGGATRKAPRMRGY